MVTEARPSATDVPRHLRPDRTIEDVRLASWLRWPIIAALVTVFLIGGKAPVWHNPFDIDRAIWLSYAPIPVLVIAGLAWQRRLGAVTVFLNTLEIALTKFALTYCIAIPLWAAFGTAPGAPFEPSAGHAPVTPLDARAPLPTPWPDDRRATVTGHVRDRAGAPIANAFVFVSGGLEDLDFARADELHTLDVAGAHFADALFVARRWQPLAGRSSDGALHTLFIEGDDHLSRNIPLLPSGERSPVRVHDLSGIVPIRCTVHRRRAHLAVMHHPFFTQSRADGSFSLERIPALPVTISVWRAARQQSVEVALEAGETAQISFTQD